MTDFVPVRREDIEAVRNTLANGGDAASVLRWAESILARPPVRDEVEVVAEAYRHRSRDSVQVTTTNIRQLGRLNDGDSLVRQSDHLASLAGAIAERDRLEEEAKQLRGPEQTVVICERGKPYTFMAKDPCRYGLCEVTYAAPVRVLLADRNQLRTDIETLRASFEDCIGSLHAEMVQKFGGQKPEDMHPVTRRDYDRDMEELAEYRAALAGLTPVPGAQSNKPPA